MPYNCWHCWAQLEGSSEIFKKFQENIEKACAEKSTMVSLFALALMLAIMLIV
jgi:hypothetical protein